MYLTTPTYSYIKHIDMLDFLSFKVNDGNLLEIRHKVEKSYELTPSEQSYIESIFKSEIERLRRLTRKMTGNNALF